jgi:hypothetical protein
VDGHLHLLEIGIQAIQLSPYRSGSRNASPRTPGRDRCFPGRLRSPSPFRIKVSHQTQEPPFKFLPATLGIRRSASWRTRSVKPSRKLRWFESNTCHNLRKWLLTWANVGPDACDLVQRLPVLSRHQRLSVRNGCGTSASYSCRRRRARLPNWAVGGGWSAVRSVGVRRRVVGKRGDRDRGSERGRIHAGGCASDAP